MTALSEYIFFLLYLTIISHSVHTTLHQPNIADFAVGVIFVYWNLPVHLS